MRWIDKWRIERGKETKKKKLTWNPGESSNKIDAIVCADVEIALFTRLTTAAIVSEYNPTISASRPSHEASALSVGDLAGLLLPLWKAALVRSSIDIPNNVAALLAADGLANCVLAVAPTPTIHYIQIDISQAKNEGTQNKKEINPLLHL